MKTMFKSLLIIIAACITLSACSKKSNVTPSGGDLGPLYSTWSTPAFGGVNNNALTFAVSSGTTTATITQVGSSPFGFAVGDQIFTNLKASGTGYTGMGKYTYGSNSQNSGMRAVNITLQNNNTQLTADYPALNSSFPEIIYVYQRVTVLF